MIRYYLFFFLAACIGFGIYYAHVIWNQDPVIERIIASAGLCVSLVCFVLTIVIYQDRDKND